MKKLTKKQWGLVAAGIILVGGFGTYAYASNQSNSKIVEAKEQLSDSSDNLKKVTKDIQALLDTKDDHYLAKDVTEAKIKTVQEKVKTAIAIPTEVELPKDSYSTFTKESKKAQDEMGKVKLAYDTQTAINSLYEKTDKKQAMNGSTLNKELPIVDNLKKEAIEKIKTTYYKEGATSSYDKTINALITGAEDQVTQLDKAKEAVSKVYKDNKIISTDSKLYDSAKAETDKVKNEKAKKELLDQLAKVKADSEKKSSEEKAKVEAEAEATKVAEANTAQAATVTPEATGQATDQAQGNSAATTTDNGYADNGGGYDASAQGANNGSGYTPPATGNGNTGGGSATPQQPSNPSTGGNSDGSLTQDQGNQAEKDAANSDWSDFFK